MTTRRGPQHQSLAANKRFANAPGIDEKGWFGPNLPEPEGSLAGLAERAGEGPQGIVPDTTYQTTLDSPTEQGTMSLHHEKDAAEAHKKLMDEQHEKAKEAYQEMEDKNNPSMIAAGAGAYGMNVLENRKQQNQAKQQEEMQRIEQIAQAGREKSGTGGGQVAVTA